MKVPSVLPDFLIAGAPKCGTTAWTEYLSADPSVFMPRAKEIHYFARDLFPPDYKYRDAEVYAAQFADASSHQTIGQAGVFHLYSSMAAARIAEAQPGIRIIIMLRNPVDLVHALHGQFVYAGREPITDFSEAMAAEYGRSTGAIPTPESVVEGELRYRRVAALDEQVERFLSVFPREQIHFVVYDDLRADTAATFDATREFLGLTGSTQADLLPVNVRRSVRSEFIRDHVVRSKSRTLRRVSSVLPDRLRWSIRGAIQRKNSRPADRSPLPAPEREQLTKEFEPVVARLSDLVGRDFRSWSQP